MLLLKRGLFMPLKLICSFHQSGVTLVELILSMVIISIALTGVLTVMNLTVSHSADPIIQHQSVAIAESYLEEILSKNYCEDDTDTINCPLISGNETGETRSTFNDVDDFDGLSDTGVKDHLGNSVAILANYNVSVSVSAVTLTDSVQAKKVTVTVSGLEGSVNLVGYRADY